MCVGEQEWNSRRVNLTQAWEEILYRSYYCGFSYTPLPGERCWFVFHAQMVGGGVAHMHVKSEIQPHLKWVTCLFVSRLKQEVAACIRGLLTLTTQTTIISELTRWNFHSCKTCLLQFCHDTLLSAMTLCFVTASAATILETQCKEDGMNPQESITLIYLRCVT